MSHAKIKIWKPIKEILFGTGKQVIINELADSISSAASSHHSTKKNISEVEALRTFTLKHFNLDSKCEVNSVIQFYDSTAYYENQPSNVEKIRDIKFGACARYTSDMILRIRQNSMKFFISIENPEWRIIDYVVDYNVYSIQQRQRIEGSTKVRLVVKSGQNDYQIIGESHEKIS